MDCQDWKPVVLSKNNNNNNNKPSYHISQKKVEKEEEKGHIEKVKMFTREFGQKVTQRRVEKGLKRSDVAKMTNKLKESDIAGIELGTSVYNPEHLRIIQKVLGYDLKME